MKEKRMPMVTISFKRGRSSISAKMTMDEIKSCDDRLENIIKRAASYTEDRLDREIDRLRQQMDELKMNW